MAKKSLKINVVDYITIASNLFNYKMWFNGLKKFSSLQIKKPLDNK